MVEIVQRNGSK
uniref:Uncharacterized protein n=1 Tax=Anguilla anguilla TaxID=7936 RepID=A0A0E9P7D8_ANGAN